jgi:hypothetical protein
MASNRPRTAADPSQCATAPSTPPSPSTNPVGGSSGRIRQWYSSGNPAYSPRSTQLFAMRCAAGSRQAPNPAEPTPYW